MGPQAAQNGYAIGLVLDLVKAFSRLPRASFHLLQKKWFKSNHMQLWLDFLQDQTRRFKIGKAIGEEFVSNCGCAEGGAISPISMAWISHLWVWSPESSGQTGPEQLQLPIVLLCRQLAISDKKCQGHDCLAECKCFLLSHVQDATGTTEVVDMGPGAQGTKRAGSLCHRRAESPRGRRS